KRVDVPKGDPRDPMTRGEIKVKYDALARDLVGQAKCDKAAELIGWLEREESLGRLFGLLTA
ncbi:MAG: hypothetical protein VYC34_08185, partial [Planctomycetota bacterium]|nr:hypothetical protein [Planctomycetota bacterium]